MKRTSNHKQKLVVLLESEEVENIKQALLLNERLGLLTKQEIGDILIPIVSRKQWDKKLEEYWDQDGLAWTLLKEQPDHYSWERVTKLKLSSRGFTRIPKEIGLLKNLI